MNEAAGTWDYLRVPISRWKLVVVVPVVVISAVLFHALVAGRSFTSRLTFAPVSTELGAGRLTGLAAQLGIGVGGLAGALGPELFVDLLTSDDFRRRLAGVSVPTWVKYWESVGRTDSIFVEMPLPYLVRGHQERWDIAHARTARRIEDLVSVSLNRTSGVVFVRVTTDSPQLSHALARSTFSILNDFNRVRRQSIAAAEREFVDGRLVESRDELATAEEAQRQFLERNRRWETSPELALTFDRLSREVALRQQVVLTLTQAFEQARIDEVRDTPALTILEAPTFPVLPDRRGLLLRLVGAGMLGLILGVGSAFAAEQVRREEQLGSAGYAAFVQALTRLPVIGPRFRRLIPKN